MLTQTLKFNIDNESEMIDNEEEEASEVSSDFPSSYENTSSYYNRDNTKKIEDEEDDEKEDRKCKSKVSFAEENFSKEKENHELRSKKSKISVVVTQHEKRMSQMLTPFVTSGNDLTSGQLDPKMPHSIMQNRLGRLSTKIGGIREEANFRLKFFK